MTSSSSCGWCLTVPSLYRIGNHAEAEEHRQWHEEPAGGTRGRGGAFSACRQVQRSTFNTQCAPSSGLCNYCIVRSTAPKKGENCVFLRKMRSYQSGQRGAEIAR
jgi:hypothetical protein